MSNLNVEDVSGINSSKVLFGSDPEVFLKDMNGNYVSAIGKFQGTKQTPVPVKSLGKGYAVQVDNVLLEYNIPAVSKSENWVKSHTQMLDYLRTKAAEKNLLISIDAAVSMPDKELQHPDAKVFGCSPDFNAWAMKINSPPRSKNPNLRSAGGHIHIGGIGQTSNLQRINIVRALDMTVGAWATLVDTDVLRKELYGRPGCMRFKDYGLEYRTVSNFWLKTPQMMETAYYLVKAALNKCDTYDFNSQQYENSVLRMFEHNDKDIAREILGTFKIDASSLVSDPVFL